VFSPPPPPVAHVAARGRPTVVGVHVFPTNFAAGHRAFIRFRLTGLHRRATARVQIQRPVRGNGGRTSWKTIQTIERGAATGSNGVSFNGEVKGRRLARGSYRVSVVWNVSAPRTAPFRII